MNVDLPGSTVPNTGTQVADPLPVPALRSLTVPRTSVQDNGLLDLLVRDDALVWGRHGEGLVGFGEVARATATGSTRFADLRRWWSSVAADAAVEDRVDLPGSGPVAFSAIAFSATSSHASRLIVPRLVVGRTGDTGWLTLVTSDPDAELSAAAAEEELARLLEEPSPERDLAPAADRLVAGQVSELQYEDSVRAGVR